GFQQREIADAAYAWQLAVEEGRQRVVGVNAFAVEEETPTEVLTIDPEGERQQVARLRALRERRGGERAAAAGGGRTAAGRGGRTGTRCLRPPPASGGRGPSAGWRMPGGGCWGSTRRGGWSKLKPPGRKPPLPARAAAGRGAAQARAPAHPTRTSSRASCQ